MRFRLRGRIVSGIAIGAVHTVAEFRGRGFAPMLMQYVEENQRVRGAQISLLYSDVDPSYYARLGYSLCAAWEGWLQPSLSICSEPGPAGRLVPLTPTGDIHELATMYDRYHSAFAISIARNNDYWEFLVSKDAADQFYWMHAGGGDIVGYVRLAYKADVLKIRDLAVSEPHHEHAQSLLTLVAQIGRQRGAQRIGGWLPKCPWMPQDFKIQKRQLEITMLKALHPEVRIDEEVLQDAQHLCEIDHV